VVWWVSVVTHQLLVKRRTAKERWPETADLPLSHADQPGVPFGSLVQKFLTPTLQPYNR